MYTKQSLNIVVSNNLDAKEIGRILISIELIFPQLLKMKNINYIYLDCGIALSTFPEVFEETCLYMLMCYKLFKPGHYSKTLSLYVFILIY